MKELAPELEEALRAPAPRLPLPLWWRITVISLGLAAAVGAFLRIPPVYSLHASWLRRNGPLAPEAIQAAVPRALAVMPSREGQAELTAPLREAIWLRMTEPEGECVRAIIRTSNPRDTAENLNRLGPAVVRTGPAEISRAGRSGRGHGGGARA